MRRASGPAAIATVAMAASAVLAAGPAAASPPLPAWCAAPDVDDGVCTARVTAVSSDAVDGTVTVTPVGGGEPISVSGTRDAYQASAGFGDAKPRAVRDWDDSIERVGALDTDQYDPAWYANAKTQALLPRSLNDKAIEFSPGILLVRFTSDASSDAFRLVSIQPAPRP